MSLYRRHDWFYRGARAVLSPLMKHLFRFEAKPAPELQGPYIVIANHTTDLDAILVSLSFPKQMYFVASEHIFRSPLLGGLLTYFLDPIPKQKGGADVVTAMQMLRRLKKGSNIGLFAEGSKSFHGKTGPVVEATGTLVKASGASLVTYRLEGGYFTSPRWAHTFRRGEMKGYTVNVYSPDALGQMTPEEINRAIARDIDEDAYRRQEREPVRYTGKQLARGLENALYMCPGCGQIGTLRGEGSRFACLCGFQTRLDELGTLSGGPFRTVDAWGEWQKEKLRERLAKAGDDEVFSDRDQTIFRILSPKEETPVAQGTLCISGRGLRLDKFHLPWSNVLGMEVYGRNSVVFSDTDGNHYRIRSGLERSGLKYMDAYRILAEK